MKKILSVLAVAIAMLASSFHADAQFSRVRFGLMGGFTSSSTNIKEIDTKSVSLYHAGVTCKVPLLLGFAIQPSVMYQVKGVSLAQAQEGTAQEALGSLQTKVGFVEIPLQVQWGPDLIVFRPYVFAEPFIGFKVGQASKIKTDKDGVIGDVINGINKEEFVKQIDEGINKMEYGLSLGAGIEFWKLQLSAKYFWNFGKMYSEGGEKQNIGDIANDFVSQTKNALSS